MARVGQYEWCEIEGAVAGGFLTALGAGGALDILVSLENLVAAVCRGGADCGYVDVGVCLRSIVWRLGIIL